MEIKTLQTVRMEPLYMSPKEAMARYGIGQTNLYELFAMDNCPDIYKLGRKVLIPVQAFDAFVQSLLVPQTTQLHSARQKGGAVCI